MLYLILGIGVLVTAGVVVGGVVLSRRSDNTRQRLDEFVGGLSETGEGEADEAAQADSSTSALTERLDQVIEERGLGGGVATDLARADLKLTVAEFWALTVISMIGVGALAWLIYGGFILPLVGVVFGFFVPKLYVKFRQRSRLKKFNDQLGDGITLMANGLRAGYSLLQAMDAVAQEMPDPIALEFKRVVREIGLGVEPERAYNNLLRRVPSDDLDLMITAINVQAEVGGNLSEILEIIGFVIRERVRIKGEIAVLTAQGQLSGYVISFLPIVLGLILFAMNKEYIGRMIWTCEARGLDGPNDMCSQPCGWIMIGGGLLMIGSGFFAIQKIVDIEV